MADRVEDLLALRGEVADARPAGDAGVGDVAFEAVEFELELLELELRACGVERARGDDELGDQVGEGLVVAREGRHRGAKTAAEIRRGLAGSRAGEVVV